VPLVLDLRIDHDRVGSSTDPTLNGQLRYPNNLDQSLNDSATDKVRSEFVRLLFLQSHRETDRILAVSGVLSSHSDRGFFHYRRAAFSTQLKRKVGLVPAEAVVLRITFNLDGSPIISKSHTHPSHSQTSRLLTSSLSLGIPVPRTTQCMRGM
jgi:hypothetical protein